jgi:hypothetical protein
MPYSAYVIDEISRKRILDTFPPQFPEVIAHHVTHKFPDDSAPPHRDLIEVVGYASDHRLECLVISLDGFTERPNGGIYHITLSIDREQGAKPVHSNHIIKAGWTPLDESFHITAQPELLGHQKKKPDADHLAQDDPHQN